MWEWFELSFSSQADACLLVERMHKMPSLEHSNTVLKYDLKYDQMGYLSVHSVYFMIFGVNLILFL